MRNPYDPPQFDASRVGTPTVVRRVFRYALFGFVGALGGYVVLFVLANLESWQFYTIRSTLTGETAMSQITMHPADPWIILTIFFICIGGGILAGLLAARRTFRRASP